MRGSRWFLVVSVCWMVSGCMSYNTAEQRFLDKANAAVNGEVTP